MCIVATSDSGHGGRFEPCEECKRLQEENEFTGNRVGLLEAENAALRQERETLLSIIDKIRWDPNGHYKSCRLCYRNYFLDGHRDFQHAPDCPLKGIFKEDEEARHAG